MSDSTATRIADTRHPLLLPASIEECYTMSMEAFDLSERLQTLEDTRQASSAGLSRASLRTHRSANTAHAARLTTGCPQWAPCRSRATFSTVTAKWSVACCCSWKRAGSAASIALDKTAKELTLTADNEPLLGLD